MVKKSAQKVYPERSRRGFTLVELLVVISIIAILATIGLVIFSSAQKSARMAKRIGDLKATQTALELYYSVNKTYPDTGAVWSNCTIPEGDINTTYIPELAPTYMPALPQDPNARSGLCYRYRSSSGGTDYKLIIWDNTGANSEITVADLQAQPSLWDQTDDDYLPQSQRCTNTYSNRRFAIWSSTASRCW